MFGYIRTNTPELRVRENEYYKAVYCGLCKSQGKCTGQCSRMTLSYDAVFLAILRLAISGENPKVKRGTCIAHPFKKRAYLENCDALSFCSYAYAILAYGKTVDDIEDEKGFKRFKARLARPFTARMRKKALKKYAPLDEKVREGLRKMSELESTPKGTVDALADTFGDILADILSYGLEGSDEKILKNIGKHVGRWIYIIDAADDVTEDIKKKRFNPFFALYGNSELTEEQRAEISSALKLELIAAEPAFDLLDIENNPNIDGIIKNIIYSGMPKVADRVLRLDGSCNCDNKRKKQKGRK